MHQRLREIEAQILDLLRQADAIEPHDDRWGSYVSRLETAKVAIWHAMDEVPE